MDILARTGICHFICVKAAPDNQTAGGAKPSLFCNMTRFLGPFVFLREKRFVFLRENFLYFSVKNFISASLKAPSAPPRSL